MNMLLQHGVTARAQVRPEAIALVGGKERISYGMLETDSNRLARLLVRDGLDAATAKGYPQTSVGLVERYLDQI